MPLRQLFATPLYEASLADAPDFAAFNAELEQACRMLAEEDRAGRAWCKAHAYGGYTSYASLTDLPQRASVFAELKRKLDRHARAFAQDLRLDLGRGGFGWTACGSTSSSPARRTADTSIRTA